MPLSTNRLYDLEEGKSMRITELHLTGVMRRRLLDLGFVPGGIITSVKKSPLGDPTAFRVSNTMIALRKEESTKIIGELV
ncbi:MULTISPECIES: FeoA family protein [Bacillaceae]|uniref:Ferrous iron transport protein A n=1 Tax=Rossellomorea vietnamensis TaxID=218284 RepID=A0A6I6UTL6_9BACI|nr:MULTISPECIES: FeoA family protein [Rossellomorea]MBH9965641.1 ferrous iron transport protein A [[Bacillus] enclensis]MBW3111161.1 ferrous iron transport protein A [Bacillus sp. MCCB 382]MDX8345185.1 FeoA family protein [Rossellomorea sp. YZS02]QHE62901.1 ferrous iron transport protein A [Rossellomorea vietnamensis]